MPQTDMILAYMQENGSITPVEAMAEFGCMRLAARIADLRQQGVKITKTTAKGINRYGEKISFAKYRLEG